jgi:hypothetical protein
MARKKVSLKTKWTRLSQCNKQPLISKYWPTYNLAFRDKLFLKTGFPIYHIFPCLTFLYISELFYTPFCGFKNLQIRIRQKVKLVLLNIFTGMKRIYFLNEESFIDRDDFLIKNHQNAFLVILTTAKSPPGCLRKTYFCFTIVTWTSVLSTSWHRALL